MPETWIQTVGPLAVFFGMMIEGEVFLLLAGYAIYRGYLDPTLTCMLGAAGGVTSDTLYFTLGWFQGPRVFRRYPKLRRLRGRAILLLRRWGRLAAFFTRFAFGFRVVLPVTMGTARFRPPVFIAFDTLGSLAFTAVYLSLGYVFGATARVWVERAVGVQRWALLALVVIALVVWAVMRRRQVRS
ncbi:DedA family protein [soil metagenome]